MILESLQRKKEKYISFSVKINVKLAGVNYEDGTQVHKNIQLRFIDSSRFMASSLDKLGSNLCGASGIQCDKCKSNMELINIFRDYIALLGCEGCRTKKTKGLDERSLKNKFNHTSRFFGCNEKIWEKGEDFTPEKIDKLAKKDKRGYILEVDVEYPKELYQNHNELPFLTKRMKIGRVEKLVPNLKDKKGYVVHI